MSMTAAGKNKIRKRYVAFVVDTNGRIRRGEMIHAINLSLPPSIPRSSAHLTIFDDDAGILLCPQEYREAVVSALGTINRVGNSRAIIKTVTTSGTIKQARLRLEKCINRSLKELNKKNDNSNDKKKPRTALRQKSRRGDQR